MRKEAINPVVCSDGMLILSFLGSENKASLPCYDDIKGPNFSEVCGLCTHILSRRTGNTLLIRSPHMLQFSCTQHSTKTEFIH
jgi:hypothetical protein